MKKKLNYSLIIITACLLVFGFLFLATLSAPASLKAFGNTNYYLFHQMLYGLVPGIFLCIIFYKIPLDFFKKSAPYLVLANLIALGLVFLPIIGSKFWGAQRWLNFGVATFQPSEFLKITAVLYLSALISNKLSEDQKKGWKFVMEKSYYNLKRVFLPFVIFLSVISLILILQPDISTLGIIALTLVAMYFSVKTPLWHVPLIILTGIGGLALLIKFEPYRLERILVFLHPEADPMGMGFHVKQSLIAIGSGGIFGKGLGMSSQKFGFLPQAMTDSVFAILGEETGILGCAILIFLFLAFFWLGIKIARKSNDKFRQLTAVGITSWIIIQAFVNVSSSMGIFPLSGIPLPFFSYGGSHLVTELIGVGLLLNISKNT